MDEEDYLKITLNGFLLNAGVVALKKLLDFAEAEQGTDYFYEGQDFFLAKRFVLENNLADLYICTMVHEYGAGSQYQAKLNAKSAAENLYKQSISGDKTAEKSLAALYSDLAKMLEKPSLKAGYEILKDTPSIEAPNDAMIEDFKREANVELKYGKYVRLIELLEQPKVKEVLVFKELMYSRINMFWEGIAFYSRDNSKKDLTTCYYAEFVEPLLAMVKENKQGKKGCIDCGSLSAEAHSLSFMQDMIDDTARKKSYYWNMNVDAFLCPLCSFVYTLVPLGFQFLGQDAVFVNNNSDVELLLSMMNTLSAKLDPAEVRGWTRLYNLFIGEKIERLYERANNIQVIFRSRNSAKYNFNIVTKDMIYVLQHSRAELEALQKIVMKNGKDSNGRDIYLNVYELTVGNVLNRRNQYPLIEHLFRLELASGRPAEFLLMILKIQIRFQQRGNKYMQNVTEVSIKRAYAAKKQGELMRSVLTSGVAEKDKDNSLRGFLYQLTNSLSCGNRDRFLELIVRAYSGCSKPVPDLFFQCFTGDDEFKTMGWAYILGLKSEHADPNKQETGKDD